MRTDRLIDTRGLAVAFLLLASNPALAAEDRGAGNLSVEDQCDRYAETAVRYQMDNLRDGCDFEGGPWHADYANHFDWCMETDPERRGEETEARRVALADCTPAEGSDDRCHDYARGGVLQQQENRRHSCEFSGEAWHSRYNDHLAWCRSVPHERSQRELAMRSELLSGCR